MLHRQRRGRSRWPRFSLSEQRPTADAYLAMGYLLRGETYKGVGGPVGTRGQPASKWDVSEARCLRAKGWTYDDLGARYGVSHVRVWQVLNR